MNTHTSLLLFSLIFCSSLHAAHKVMFSSNYSQLQVEETAHAIASGKQLTQRQCTIAATEYLPGVIKAVETDTLKSQQLEGLKKIVANALMPQKMALTIENAYYLQLEKLRMLLAEASPAARAVERIDSLSSIRVPFYVFFPWVFATLILGMQVAKAWS